MAKNLLVFGHGYTARHLASVLIPLGWQITGTTRSADDLELIRQSGARALVWPGDDVTEVLNAATHVLISAGPDENGDPVLSQLRQQLSDSAGRLEWVGYLSTTAVYGDHQGGWVDENTPPTPATRRGELRLKAEKDWLELADQTGLPLHVFRLAGIYGPGRGPFAKVLSGSARRIVKKNQVFSRIHVADIANVLQASISLPNPGAIYNICDDEAAPPEDVIAYAAELLGLPIPEAVSFETADLTPMARSFYGESKRVRNERIKTELGIELIYPTYREGLSAMAVKV